MVEGENCGEEGALRCCLDMCEDVVEQEYCFVATTDVVHTCQAGVLHMCLQSTSEDRPREPGSPISVHRWVN
jgi:hypothetical protein